MLQERPLVAPSDVPFLALDRVNSVVKDAVLRELADLIDDGDFTNGPRVEAFERAFASFCGTHACVGVASGLDALRIALLGLGIGPGDEVIVPGATFVATYEAVTQTGATPVPVDISEHDYCLDVAAAAAAVGRRTRAILPVHLYGQMPDMRAIYGLAEAYGLGVVEDACQAHGALRNGIRPGEISDAAAFSFYPSKNLGAFGDAGAIVTNDPALAATARSLREHGQFEKYRHESIGYTARLDAVQAVVLLAKLEHLDAWNRERAAAAQLYDDALSGIDELRLPAVAAESRPAWHVYVVRTPRRDALRAYLGGRGIGTGVHYPEAPPHSGAYAALEPRRGALTVTAALSRECLSLPLFPGITEAEQRAVVSAIWAFFDDER
jgi:dTDP-3-amino-3,4,6-trideoxy-alpha-D-glucose transaminase